MAPRAVGLVLAGLAGLASADLPVHCLRSQVVGRWRIHQTSSSPDRTSCGHSRPDTAEQQPDVAEFLRKDSLQVMELELRQPNAVHAANGSRIGHFTMVYDEGFEASFSPENGEMFHYFAFSRFELGSAGKATSMCPQTMVGWYSNEGRTQFGCYVGVRAEGAALLQSADQLASSSRGALLDPVATSMQADDDGLVAESSAVAGSDAPLSLAQHARVAERINARNAREGLAWRARAHPQFGGLSRAQLNGRAGIRRSVSLAQAARQTAAAARDGKELLVQLDECSGERTLGSAEATARSANEQRLLRGSRDAVLARLVSGSDELSPCELRVHARYVADRQKAARELLAKYPKALDWRSARGGRNFVDPVTDQRDCGSCYAVSATQMLSARHRVAQDDESVEPWSIAFSLFCAEYNQGCKGGYAYLASAFARDVGLLPQRCQRYSTEGKCGQLSADCRVEFGLAGSDAALTATHSSTTARAAGAARRGAVRALPLLQARSASGSIAKTKPAMGRFRADDVSYIGGYYGGVTAEAMMEELLKHGPMVVSFEPAEEFMYYEGGIFTSNAPGKPSDAEWQQVDHAVLLVGWGEEMGQPYWLIQNSWGTSWGEGGYFRITRGNNDSGVESIASSAKVVPDDRNILNVMKYW